MEQEEAQVFELQRAQRSQQFMKAGNPQHTHKEEVNEALQALIDVKMKAALVKGPAEVQQIMIRVTTVSSSQTFVADSQGSNTMHSVRNNGSQCDNSHDDEEMQEQSPEALCPQTSQVQGKQKIQPKFAERFAEVISKADTVRKRKVLLTMQNMKIPPELLDHAEKAIAEVVGQKLDCLLSLNMAVINQPNGIRKSTHQSGNQQANQARKQTNGGNCKKFNVSNQLKAMLVIHQHIKHHYNWVPNNQSTPLSNSCQQKKLGRKKLAMQMKDQNKTNNHYQENDNSM
uniref:Uncharacterized protein n=1 Tax=Romanomermis culicivorax TaxID=13658 RepID=A0A915J5E1_ROMCU